MQRFHLGSDYAHAVEAEKEEHMKRESVDLWQQEYSNPHSTVPCKQKTQFQQSLNSTNNAINNVNNSVNNANNGFNSMQGKIITLASAFQLFNQVKGITK